MINFIARNLIQQTIYFSEKENWGNLDYVSSVLIHRLIYYRKTLGQGCKVHLSPVKGAVYAESGHSDKSWHKIIKGRNSFAEAADIFPEGRSLLECWAIALHSGFKGIGVYPYWKYPKKGLTGGLHLDMRFNQRNITGWWQDAAREYHWLSDANEYHTLIQELLLLGLTK